MSSVRESAGRSRTFHTSSGRSLAALTVGALGVVYGDIGTSPLYALQATFTNAVQPDRAGVYGVSRVSASRAARITMCRWRRKPSAKWSITC